MLLEFHYQFAQTGNLKTPSGDLKRLRHLAVLRTTALHPHHRKWIILIRGKLHQNQTRKVSSLGLVDRLYVFIAVLLYLSSLALFMLTGGTFCDLLIQFCI